MKHLKSYNESNNKNIIDIQDYCNTYLAYLIDNGFNVYIEPGSKVWERDFKDYNPYIEQYRLRLYKGYTFNWSEISDQFIPFLHMLNKDYDLSNSTIVFRQSNGDKESFSVTDVLEKYFSYDFTSSNKTDNIRKELGFTVSKSYTRVTIKSVTINYIKIK